MSIIGAAKSFVCYGCVDFANNTRTLAYHQWACQAGMYPEGGTPIIENLCVCIDDNGVYADPITDNVCWYDPLVPESAEFLGVIVLGITGMRNSTFSREVLDGFLSGSILQRPRLRGKSFGFDVLLLATSCEGMNYGEEWLRSVLEDTGCQSATQCQSCGGREMAIRVHCAEDAVADDGLHVWHSVGLTDGMTAVDRQSRARGSCCTLRQFTFTMQSESPYSFSTPGVDLCTVEADPLGFVRCFNWSTDCFDCEEDCCDKCGFDALCTCYRPEPIETVMLGDDCFCTPLAKIVGSCCASGLPHGYDTAFKIDVFSGTDWSNDHYKQYGMRNLTIKLYDNPMGLACITDDDSYDEWCRMAAPCAELKIAYVPENSTLTIDGRTEKITLSCNGKCIPYGHVVTASDGTVFPLISRCHPMMVVSEWDYYNTQVLPAAAGVAPASVSVQSFLRFRN